MGNIFPDNYVVRIEKKYSSDGRNEGRQLVVYEILERNLPTSSGQERVLHMMERGRFAPKESPTDQRPGRIDFTLEGIVRAIKEVDRADQAFNS